MNAHAASQLLAPLAVEIDAVEMPLERAFLGGDVVDQERLLVDAGQAFHYPVSARELLHALAVERAEVQMIPTVALAPPHQAPPVLEQRHIVGDVDPGAAGFAQDRARR